jgi:threonine synthase
MNFYSTNNKDLKVPFMEAVFNSLPADKGLYMPQTIPQMNSEFMRNLHNYTFSEISFEVAKALLDGAIPDEELQKIVSATINFDAPLVQISDKIHVLELFHGSSLAFKDFGARFMSRVMAYFMQQGEKELNVLVATSGDTGGAVALGFLNVPNTRVTILYPKEKVSPIQELQLTTNGQNIRAIEIDGTFDDCQALVKRAFNDEDLKSRFRLTSANSINISRLIPQTFYYFYAYAQMQRKGIKDIVFSVPSGNFGNIAAGLLAYKMGLPVKQFLAATNVNDTVPSFLKTGIYEAKPSVQTWSNAMDVGNPSNWVRIMDLFDGNMDALKNILTGYSFTDQETLNAIQELYEEQNYVMCPHTAIAYLAVKRWKIENPADTSDAIFLSTAHPCKFPDVFPKEIAEKIEIPPQVSELEDKMQIRIGLGNGFELFKRYLLG